jgi:Flp pilus assembly protein TadB
MRNTLKLSIAFTLLLFVANLQTTFAAVSNSNLTDFSTITTENTQTKMSKKTLRKQFRKAVKSIQKGIKNVKETVKEQASNGQLLVLGLVGLGVILLGQVLSIGLLVSIGGIVVVIAVVWFILKLLNVM